MPPHQLFNYKAPAWFLDHTLAKTLNKVLPKHRLNLVEQTTPIQRLDLGDLLSPKAQQKFKLYIKRDDQTHTELQLQGNKLRKLEFLFGDALSNKCKHILTAGGLQSNHARTVAAVCSKLNMTPHLFLRSHTNDPNKLETNGNLLMSRLLGANVYLIEKKAQYAEHIKFKMDELEAKLKEKHANKENVYKIPIGGSNTIGLFGYIEQFDEMLRKQNIDQFVDDIVVTTGSGGTMAGLAIANYMTGSKIKLHAFCVCDNSQYFYSHLKDQLNELFPNESINPAELVNIIECSKGMGYANSSKEELVFIRKALNQTGILFDPVYTGKTMYALANLLNEARPTVAYGSDKAAMSFLDGLKGRRVLFVHTGGQLGVFDAHKFDLIFDNKSVFNCFNQNFDALEI